MSALGAALATNKLTHLKFVPSDDGVDYGFLLLTLTSARLFYSLRGNKISNVSTLAVALNTNTTLKNIMFGHLMKGFDCLLTEVFLIVLAATGSATYQPWALPWPSTQR